PKGDGPVRSGCAQDRGRIIAGLYGSNLPPAPRREGAGGRLPAKNVVKIAAENPLTWGRRRSIICLVAGSRPSAGADAVAPAGLSKRNLQEPLITQSASGRVSTLTHDTPPSAIQGNRVELSHPFRRLGLRGFFVLVVPGILEN